VWTDSTADRGCCCVVETLEDRRLLSAADVFASLRPLPYWPAHARPAVHAPIEVGNAIKAAKAAAKAEAKAAKLAKKAEKKNPPPVIEPPIEESTTPTVELTPKEKKAVLDGLKPEVDLLGTWSGTFVRNQDRATLAGSVTFDTQKKNTAVGRFDMSAVAGQTVTSAVTVGKDHAFLAMLILNGGGQVSLAGAVSPDENSIVGRWSLQTKAGWKTGVFELKRES
jgi:hypothetical protein